MKMVITGGHGLIGSALCRGLSDHFEIFSPDRTELDLLNPEQIEHYLQNIRPDIILHAGAMVNAGGAEAERGKMEGYCWRTNVDGTRVIVETAKKLGARVLYLSTGSVFHGTQQTPGPFVETDIPEANPDKNNWYGFTKYQGELTNPDVIVRISHPLIPQHLQQTKEDYPHRLLRLYQDGSLFPLFPDQLFPLTYLPDLIQAIRNIIKQQAGGIFHVVTPDFVSPFVLLTTILDIKNIPGNAIVKLPIEEFYKKGNDPRRFATYAALSSTHTQNVLGMTFTPWKKAVEEVFGAK